MTAIIKCEVSPSVVPDFKAIKNRQHSAWSSGDYAIVGTTLQIVGENLADAADLCPGQKVLDVAAGNGNATLAAARRWCEVTSTDYVDTLLQHGRRRAEAERLSVTFRQADAEALPFADGTFDAVVSTFGVMFAPDQSRAAAEMARVLKPGGRIGLANWTPDGFIGQLFKLLGRYVPPAAGVKSPALWGTRDGLENLFDAKNFTISAEPAHFRFRYGSAEHFLEVFKTYYGPILKAFESLEKPTRDALALDMRKLITSFNKAADGTVNIPSEYLQIVITKR